MNAFRLSICATLILYICLVSSFSTYDRLPVRCSTLLQAWRSGKECLEQTGMDIPRTYGFEMHPLYQKDWILYLNDRSPNHKDSNEIVEELADATGIDRECLISFHPGTGNIRKTLQWASSRITTRQKLTPCLASSSSAQA
jgi:hypothetical protein